MTRVPGSRPDELRRLRARARRAPRRVVDATAPVSAVGVAARALVR